MLSRSGEAPREVHASIAWTPNLNPGGIARACGTEGARVGGGGGLEAGEAGGRRGEAGERQLHDPSILTCIIHFFRSHHVSKHTLAHPPTPLDN